MNSSAKHSSPARCGERENGLANACLARRSHLQLCLLGGLGLLVSGCRSPLADAALRRFEFEQPQMGLPFRIVLYAESQAVADTAAQAAFARVAELNQIFSDYEDDSELTKLSRTSGGGQAVKVSDELWRLLVVAQNMSRRSEGAFDITVGPLVQVWRRTRRQRELPTPEVIAEAKARVGWENVVLDPRARTAKLLVPGMRLDFGSIAKGRALDEALRVLRQHGITRALVTGSGDMAIGDPPPGRTGWRIELAPLDALGAPPTRFLSLRNCGFATSGDLFQHVELGGKRYSHIVDPRTAMAMTDHSLVTVIARDAVTANSLSTTTCVVGPERGLALVAATPGALARVVRKPGERVEVTESPRFTRFYEQ
jgi:FAD:protein FMN transferase